MVSATKPNILVIWADGIERSSLSCYSRGLMAFRTPSIDRLAHEGMLFDEAYGDPGGGDGGAFITGQVTSRTGLARVGVPAAPIGLRAGDITIARLLGGHGYATAQFGKTQLGDRNEHLPTLHGFDEFFGQACHLNAGEARPWSVYASDGDIARLHERFGPRGVLRSWTSDTLDPTLCPRWGRVGKQKIESVAPVSARSDSSDEDQFLRAARAFVVRQHTRCRPFFLWLNTTHPRSDAAVESNRHDGRSWHHPHHDTMIDHDRQVGEMLDCIDGLGIAQRTFVVYSAAGRGQDTRAREPGFTRIRFAGRPPGAGNARVPLLVRWPGRVAGGSVSAGLVHVHDWLPTLLSLAGEGEVRSRLLAGYRIGGCTFTHPIDGHDLLPYLVGEARETPRQRLARAATGAPERELVHRPRY